MPKTDETHTAENIAYDQSLNRLLTLVFIALVPLTLYTLRGRVPVPRAESPPNRADRLETRLDPNVATPAELTALPGIGPTKALRIVDYRNEKRSESPDPLAPVFTTPDDLLPITGIGPKTVKRLRAQLRFPESSPAPSTPE